MKSLFENETINEINTRINSLTEDSKPLWGKMNVGQMLKHSQVPYKVLNGTKKVDSNIGPIKKFIFSMMKPIMYNDKPWKKNIPTGKEFIVTDDVDFTSERKTLLTLVNDFHKKKDQKEWPPHPIFGEFTPEQWGKMSYKHLDHHLKQFGV